MELFLGDCLNVLRRLPDNSIDGVVTDPPYELGFMGKSWDNTGIANNKEIWGECLRVLKPGGHLLSFGGTRTYHRMACAIEDAGFEVRDMIEWVYGSGFPKSLNIGKAVDKLQGNEREEMINERWVERYPNGPGGNLNPEKYGQCKRVVGNPLMTTKGTSEWEGWGTALKPAHEPICMARKPIAEKTVAENCLKYGTGGINIDESRVETQGKDLDKLNSEWDREWNTSYSDYADKVGGNAGFNMDKANKENAGLTGRFPANLIHDNSEEVRECFPNESKRFFKSIIYTAKASKSERNKGYEGLEEKAPTHGSGNERGGLQVSNNKLPNTNNHPTVKPIALMEYLIKMITPKGGVVLDLFMGSGSTGVAAIKNGFDFIGIEKEADYIKIAEARIANVKEQKTLFKEENDGRLVS